MFFFILESELHFQICDAANVGYFCVWVPNFLLIRPKAPFKVWQDPLLRFIFTKINVKICFNMEIEINFLWRNYFNSSNFSSYLYPLSKRFCPSFKKNNIECPLLRNVLCFLIKFEQVALDQNLFKISTLQFAFFTILWWRTGLFIWDWILILISMLAIQSTGILHK